ncbi:hypothetical protein [Vitiosangium sp. GDMCC 1.1324]|uniref:hypothetical protein n=1 Tax=Vitiosangium sp. (strain GDMCC 1.1324) TaxID=2138576 RepID=UPI0018EEA2A8|nr:hypothetical protein [Vitiosangium sp. GDMCC 1.1324]
MSKQMRYLLTVDPATGAAVKLERLGEAGDLTEVPLSTLAIAPTAAQAAPPAPQSLVINIYMGGPQQAAPLSISLPGLIGPGGPGGPAPNVMLAGPGGPGGPAPSVTLAGPGGPGVPGGPAPSVTLAGPGGPGGPAPATTLAGPGGPGGPGGGEGSSR